MRTRAISCPRAHLCISNGSCLLTSAHWGTRSPSSLGDSLGWLVRSSSSAVQEITPLITGNLFRHVADRLDPVFASCNTRRATNISRNGDCRSLNSLSPCPSRRNVNARNLSSVDEFRAYASILVPSVISRVSTSAGTGLPAYAASASITAVSPRLDGQLLAERASAINRDLRPSSNDNANNSLAGKSRRWSISYTRTEVRTSAQRKKACRARRSWRPST